MKLLFMLLFVLTPVLNAQDTVRLKYTNYTSVFSKSLRYPIYVEWLNTRDEFTCKNPTARTDKFAPDVRLKESNVGDDYVGSGFDRGHLSPAADSKCGGASVMVESFYFTNMVPQYPNFNRGVWKLLEEHSRELALAHDSVVVKAGCLGVSQKIGKLSIPTHCWKIVTVKKTKTTHAYLFPNISSQDKEYANNIVTLDSLRKITTLKLK